MPLDALLPQPFVTPQTPQATPDGKPSAAQPCAAAVAAARSCLATYLAAPASAEAWTNFSNAVQAAANAAAALPHSATDAILRADLGELIRKVVAAGVQERLAVSDAAVPVAKGWPGLVAQMLLRPAWAIAVLPELERVPEWLMLTCAEWLFAVPESFAAPGQADAYAAHCERQLTKLVEGVERNPGALAVRTALDHYQTRSNQALLRLSSQSLRRHAELHARLIARLERKKISVEPPVAIGREGRLLRLGFVVPEFDGSAAMHATMPLLGHLDPDRFETQVFILRPTENRWESAVRQSAAQVQTLPADVAEQAALIAGSMLDVLVFCGELTGSFGDLAKLATARLAPLQVATSAHHGGTTGFVNIDVFVAGAFTEVDKDPAQFSERLAVMAGPARTFDFVTGTGAVETQITRADVGLPADAVVFAAAADWTQITPEVLASWSRLLSAVPNSRLLFQRTGADAVDADIAARACAAIDRALAGAGIADDRSVLLTAVPASQHELEAVLSLGDVYLDVSGEDAAAVAALSRGVPVVTHAGAHLRGQRVAALLRSIGCSELIAPRAEEMNGLVVGLARNAEQRAGLAERIRSTMACVAWPFDALATGDAFGDVLESAFDEMLSVGERKLHGNDGPIQINGDAIALPEHLRAAEQALSDADYFNAAAEARQMLRAQPANAVARALLGRALLGLGQVARAVDYLLPAVEAADANAARWLYLAQAMHGNGQSSEAIQALQTSLQLDVTNGEAWLMLIDLAEAVGATDLARDAFTELKRHAPNHPQIAALSARLGC
ncbi:tetratricopeptide repeat protein [Opitutus terrae]|uniref:protein O-GlcNAc transferase n=1 Tax=Opitutus terrae (strain DSM 11246 / JCM 15787 / PB90-1) TaxID=452637 RepID=B1ZRQ6_OPITP|nr:tetratricopeptide repeat protein [Opitutus terrae]ACB73749.1 Tetratricopeptide TPR_2 repeat protein [Opitutus terrae PB90-1]